MARLPAQFGNWNSLFKRFRRWALSGVIERVFNVLSDEFDFEYVFVDGTIVSTHQKASGAKGTCHQGIGRSRGSLSSKIVAVADALGYLVRFMILPGLVHDLAGGAGTSGGSSVRGLDRGQGIRRGLVARGTREAWR